MEDEVSVEAAIAKSGQKLRDGDVSVSHAIRKPRQKMTAPGAQPSADSARTRAPRRRRAPADENGVSADKERTRLCKYFAQGNCRSGDNCKFLHAASENRSDVLKTDTGSSAMNPSAMAA